MRRLARIVLALLAIATVAFGRDTPISGGKLVSDLNANGFAITNLPSGFFPAESDPTVPDWAKNPVPPVPTETDPTVPDWAKADSPPASGGITTNDVCAIVTNEVAVFTRWTILRDAVDVTAQVQQPSWEAGTWYVWRIEGDIGPDDYPSGNEDATNLSWTCETSDPNVGIIGVSYIATRTRITRNALGIVRSSDISTNNTSFVEAVTNCPGYARGGGGGGNIPESVYANIASLVTNLAARPFMMQDAQSNIVVGIDTAWTNLETVINFIKGQ